MSSDPSQWILDPANAAFVEELYDQYLKNPSSVPADWRTTFEEWRARDGRPTATHREVQADIRKQARSATPVLVPVRAPTSADAVIYSEKQISVLRLINQHRLYGHLRASINPIPLQGLPQVPELDPYQDGLDDTDMDRVFHTGPMPAPAGLTLRQIWDRVKRIYTGSIGVEYMHIPDFEQKKFIQMRMEKDWHDLQLDSATRKRVLRGLVAAEGLEQYLHRRYVGQKRFSLEGGESLIPMLEECIQRSGEQGVKEAVIGMAHRGRLNTLVNVLGKQPKNLFSEFEGKAHIWDDKYVGDVKYHAGFSSDVQTPGGPVHLAMAFNPSHLEIINPVVEGSVRCRQDRYSDATRSKVLPILIHGDAAVAGQGVVYETVQLSDTRGYGTGGTLHIVINNQIGFTINHPDDARSSLYCTDVGKVVNAPIFHVNGDDPEAVIFTIRMAVDFRMKFKKDVFIDLVCYRRRGHNEGDEPTLTQPLMYAKIHKTPTTAALYHAKLKNEGVESSEFMDLRKEYDQALDKGDQVAPHILPNFDYAFRGSWQPFIEGKWNDPADTRVPLETLKAFGARMVDLPKTLALHPNVKKVYDDRAAMYRDEHSLDWGSAETLAYATLLNDKYHVRLSGQDVGRGTFSHRHAVIHDQQTGDTHIPLTKFTTPSTRLDIIDSILSEEAVLGFEYGYSTTDPNALVIWEAQFGDFVNGAQVVIDQFISSSQQKWRLLCGVVLFLPHGWEGQGPEHSSARLERFLQLCAHDNMQVVVPSTAGQMFHLLRRQMLRKTRLPLVVLTPKSLLRRKDSFTPLAELAGGEFKTVIGEVEPLDPAKVLRAVVCSGKIYYEVAARRKLNNLDHTAIIRLEQLYPFPGDALRVELDRYPNLQEVIWTQEEPRNQGAWYQIQHPIRSCITKIGVPVSFAGREASAAPAGGSPSLHVVRENKLLNVALALPADTPSGGAGPAKAAPATVPAGNAGKPAVDDKMPLPVK